MKGYKVLTADVTINFVETPDKVPRKLIKGELVPSVEPLSVLDKESIIDVKGREGGGLIITVYDTLENRRTLEIWERIQALRGRRIERGSREDEEYSRLELELNRTELGRVLGCAVNLEWEETPEEAVEKILEDQELQEELKEFLKLTGYDISEIKRRLEPYVLIPGWKKPEELRPESMYYCLKCNLIFKGEDLDYNVCPKCTSILSEIIQTSLWKVDASMINKRVKCKVIVAGEGPTKAAYVKWEIECRKCGAKAELDFSSPELRLTFYETLMERGAFRAMDVLRIFSRVMNLGECKARRHYWSLTPLEPAINFREVLLRDDVSFEEVMEKSTITRDYPVVLIGERPESQRINVIGTIVLNPKDNTQGLIVDTFEEASPAKPIALTEEDRALLKSYFKVRSLDELLTFSEKYVCPSIIGRPEPKLAALLTVCSPLWVSLDGRIPISATLRTMFVGDKRCGKGAIIRWFYEEVGIGEHGIGETASRAGLSYYVDPEMNTIVWGLLPQADRGLALIEALHGLPSEQMLEFREILVSQKVEVRKKVIGSRWARTRIIADANPPKAMSQYVYPAFAITSLRCFHDPVDMTRWDCFVPFFSYDVPEEEIAKARPMTSDPKFIEALRKLINWVWNLKMEQIHVTEEAVQRLEEAAVRLMQNYSLDDAPLIHNASKWSILRLACGFATITLSTEDFEALTVRPECVDLAEAFIQRLLRLWRLDECRAHLRVQPLTEEKLQGITAYLRGREAALRILEALALKPLVGESLAAKVGYDYGYVRRVLSELRQMGLVDRGASGYALTPLGTEVCRRIKGGEAEGGEVEGTYCWACRRLVLKGYVVAEDGRPYCMECYKGLFSRANQLAQL